LGQKLRGEEALDDFHPTDFAQGAFQGLQAGSEYSEYVRRLGLGKPSGTVDNNARLFAIHVTAMQHFQNMGSQSLAVVPSEDIGAVGLDEIECDHILVGHKFFVSDIFHHAVLPL
jgi:hypothetical protein